MFKWRSQGLIKTSTKHNVEATSLHCLTHCSGPCYLKVVVKLMSMGLHNTHVGPNTSTDIYLHFSQSRCFLHITYQKMNIDKGFKLSSSVL